jgi:hypothetical protein
MTKLAYLISMEEGFWKPGTQPARKHNPGDLRHSPHSSHAGEGPNDIGIIDTDEDGFDDLERQLELYAERGLTLEQAIYDFAPPNENNSAKYLADICKALPLPPDAPMREALKIAA